MSEPFQARIGAGQRFLRRGQCQPRQQISGQRTGKPHCRLAGLRTIGVQAQRHQLHIVHDDEAVQVSQQLFVLVGGNFQFQRVPVAPHVQVALNASLRIENKIPCSGVLFKAFHRVGDHAVEPAEAVFAAHRHAPQPAQIVNRDPGKQRRCFFFRCVQLLRGQYAAISLKLQAHRGLSQQGCQRSGCGNPGESVLNGWVLVRGVSGRGVVCFSHRKVILRFQARISMKNSVSGRILIIALEEDRESG